MPDFPLAASYGEHIWELGGRTMILEMKPDSLERLRSRHIR